MAMLSGLFNSVKKTDGSYDRTYDAEFFKQLLGQLCYQGVSNDGFEVTANGGLTLTVSPGCGIIGGIFFYNKSSTTLFCAASSSTRTELVVARLNEAERTVTLAVSQADTPNANEIALAQITVSGSAVTNVADTRSCYNFGAVCSHAFDSDKVDGHSIYVQQSQPTFPSTGDLWFW